MPTVNVVPADIEAVAAQDALAHTLQANTTTIRLNRRHRRRRRRRRPSVTASSETTTDGSFRFSDTENDGSRSNDECSFSTETEAILVISDNEQRRCSRLGGSSCADDESNEKDVDLESGELEMKVYRKREKRRKCRICHLSVAGNGVNSGDRRIIELGCCCKGDLGSAHKQCAETWFKIKGNTTCEICGAIATNIAGELPIETNNSTPATTTTIAPTMAAPSVLPETQTSFWHGRRFMNFLLACMIFAFIISWLFHFKILPFTVTP